VFGVRDADEVAVDPEAAARQAVEHVMRTVRRWWLHVDLDVLDPREFPAQGLPGVQDEPGGLSVAELSTLLVAAAGNGGCVGLRIAIYGPRPRPRTARRPSGGQVGRRGDRRADSVNCDHAAWGMHLRRGG
jgi:arginase family enzyme